MIDRPEQPGDAERDKRRDILLPDTVLIDDLTNLEKSELIVKIADDTLKYAERNLHELNFVAMILSKAIMHGKLNDLVLFMAKYGAYAQLLNGDLQRFVIDAASKTIDEMKKKAAADSSGKSTLKEFDYAAFERAMKGDSK